MLPRNLNVTLIESDTVWGDKQANLDWLAQQFSNLPAGTDLVVLPEMFSTGFITDDRERASQLAERNTGDTMNLLHGFANERHVAICGSFLANTATQLYNRAFFIEPNGDDTFYDKRHLFAFGGENKIYHASRQTAPIIRFRGINIKLIVCYDLRFPVFCRNVRNNYDLLVVVANWPKARRHAWETLLMARALENECYVCGVNRCGISPDGVDYDLGSSVMVDFKGRVIARREAGSPFACATVSPEQLSRFREKFPAWRDADTFTLQ